MKTTSYKQTATYWASPTTNGYGVITFAAPKTLTVRWEERAEKFISFNGEEVVSRAIVWVKEDVDVGGYLFLGTSTAADPSDVDNAYEIRQFYKTPDLRNLFNERKVYL